MKNKKILREKLQLEKTRTDIEVSRQRFLQKLQEENQNSLNIHQYFTKTLGALAFLFVLVGSTRYFLSTAPQFKEVSDTSSIHYEIEEYLNEAYLSNYDEVEDTDNSDIEVI